MRILMLGGSLFAGRAAVGAAAARGWAVTVFNRGRTSVPGLPDVAGLPGVEYVRGDRTDAADLAALAGRGPWDAVVDTWSGDPHAVAASAAALRGAAGRYVYVSSRSVYRQPSELRDETAPVVDPEADERWYGTDKRAGELAAVREFGPERTLLARAGLILGPGETVGRLPWWLHRFASGRPVPEPAPLALPLQYVDVRDLAEFLLDGCAEGGPSGPVNTVGPRDAATTGRLLDACAAAVGGAARRVPLAAEALLAAGVEPWNDLPIWIPEGHEYRFLHESDTAAAEAAGLAVRPLEETVADTWAWLRGLDAGALRPIGGRSPIGLTADQERALFG